MAHRVSILVFVTLAGMPCRALPANVTFNNQILRILQAHCQSCHRPGEAVPMPLLDYRSVRPWAKAIRTATLGRTMPPWFADPRYGSFANDRRLSDADIRTIAAWVDAGAPEGEPEDKPVEVRWHQGWNVRPDVVLESSAVYAVPASGTLEYVYLVIPTGFTKDTWVAAAEIRPGTRAAVHHINAVIRPPGEAWLGDLKPGEFYVPDASVRDGRPDSTDPQARLISANDEFLAGYAPGMQAQRFDMDQSAKLIPAGSDIVLQIHYTANGKAGVEDRPAIGLTIAESPPPNRFYSATAMSSNWEIPPGDPAYEGHARITFGEPVKLISVQPHMHLRGKDMTVRVLYPAGGSKTLLSVPRYSFAWQIIYYFSQPLSLPAGAKVEVTAHWDNSANNPNNPDPRKAVKWGNQSWEEMLSVPLGIIMARD